MTVVSSRSLDAGGPTRRTLDALKVATVGIVALGVVATWLAMSLPRFPTVG